MIGAKHLVIRADRRVIAAKHPVIGANAELIGAKHPVIGANAELIGAKLGLIGAKHLLIAAKAELIAADHLLIGAMLTVFAANAETMAAVLLWRGANHEVVGVDVTVIEAKHVVIGADASVIAAEHRLIGTEVAVIGPQVVVIGAQRAPIGVVVTVIGAKRLTIASDVAVIGGEVGLIAPDVVSIAANASAIGAGPFAIGAELTAGPCIRAQQCNDWLLYQGGTSIDTIRLAAIGVLLLAPLGSIADEPTEPNAETQGGLRQVRAKGELRWGADSQGGAPYVFQDPTDPNHLIGFEVDLAEALARELGVRARPVQGQWDSLLELLHRGDFDVALNGIEVADEKKRVCDLSRPYYAAAERLTVRRGDTSAPRTAEALKGRKVGTLPGSLAERILKRLGAEVKTYDGGQNDIFDDLLHGNTDAVLLDAPITRYYGEIEPGLEVLPDSFGEVQYAVAVPHGEPELVAALDAAIAKLGSNGELAHIYGRWGLWNAETAKLFPGSDAESHVEPVAFDEWTGAVGKQPPFWTRVTERYPRMMPLFAQGAALTLVVSLASMALAVVLGVTLALTRVFGPAPLRWLAVAYIEFFRGTPLLIQLTMVYFGLPELGIKLHPFVAGWLALGLNYASAEAENYRAGLGSVSAGQLEAARTLGMSTFQALRHVIAPQAFRVAIPPATNDFIALLKDSSLVSVVTLTELTKTYVNLASATRDHLGLGAVVAAWYLALSLPFARLSRWVEDRLGRHVRRANA